ncbi:MAG: hypothetical protein Q8K78_10765 [Planctomycetaceae bacterium]|nr:hypothetical protein [Planctomycetaceae bacterium]
MTSGLIPVNRWSVGLIAAACFVLAGVVHFTVDSGAAELWEGALSRVGVVMCAVWLAMPTRTRDAAWAHISWQTLAGGLLGLVMIVRTRVPLKLLIPAALFSAGVYFVLRPRPKTRPQRRA